MVLLCTFSGKDHGTPANGVQWCARLRHDVEALVPTIHEHINTRSRAFLCLSVIRPPESSTGASPSRLLPGHPLLTDRTVPANVPVLLRGANLIGIYSTSNAQG